MGNREEIVSEARKWLGTPFRTKGRIRGRGVDCVGLPLCVMRDLGLADWTNEEWARVYPDQPMTDMVLEICRARLGEKAFEDRLPGDLLVFRVPTVACHAAIATDVGMIHAYAGGVARVVEHRIDYKWERRIAGAFTPPGIRE